MVDFVINKMFVQFDGLVFQCVCSATRLFLRNQLFMTSMQLPRKMSRSLGIVAQYDSFFPNETAENHPPTKRN